MECFGIRPAAGYKNVAFPGFALVAFPCFIFFFFFFLPSISYLLPPFFFIALPAGLD